MLVRVVNADDSANQGEELREAEAEEHVEIVELGVEIVELGVEMESVELGVEMESVLPREVAELEGVSIENLVKRD